MKQRMKNLVGLLGYNLHLTSNPFCVGREARTLHPHLSRCQVRLDPSLSKEWWTLPSVAMVTMSCCSLQVLTCCPATTAWGVPSFQTQTSPTNSSHLMSTRPHWQVNLWPVSHPPWPATPPSLTATTQRPSAITAALPPSLRLEAPSCLHRLSHPCCQTMAESLRIYFWYGQDRMWVEDRGSWP